MTGIPFKVTKGHDPDSEWGREHHQMVLIGRREGVGKWRFHEYRDKNGGKRGSTTLWHIAVCNAPDCGAEMLVRLEDTIDAVAAEAFGP